jgi:hypothetical protein
MTPEAWETILYSPDWSNETQNAFFKELEKLTSPHDKARLCLTKAKYLSGKHPHDALSLLTFALQDFPDMKRRAEAETHHLKGMLYEYFIADYFKAYEAYTAWQHCAPGNMPGLAFARVRSLLRVKKLEVDDEFLDLIEPDEYTVFHPTKPPLYLFWVAALQSGLCVYAGDPNKARESAKLALFHYMKGGANMTALTDLVHPESWDMAYPTPEELQILKKRIGQ